ncbi:MAG: response regulator [Rhodospirillaceae bacterium]|nr:response regulator [Rhodospirillales bacterium]
MPWRIEQITSRFLAIVVSVAALMAVLVAGVVAWRQFETQRQRLDLYMGELARLNAVALIEPMWTINESASRSIIWSLGAHPEVACAELLEPNGTVVAATRDGGCEPTFDANRMSHPVAYNGYHLGDLILWVSRRALSDSARADVHLTVLVFLLLSCVMVVTAVFALRATVIAPLDRLIAAIRVGKVAANLRPKDELGRVITAYNGLLDRVERHTAELEDARAQAVAAAQAKSRFLATMSHEIRTPMHGVLGTVELLRETSLSGDQRKYADVILHSTESLLGIINDILDLSKIEAGKVRIALGPASPSHIAQEVIGALSATARGKGVLLHLTWTPDTPGWVMADAMRLRQVMLNLVGNGVKFTEKGAVTVALRRASEWLVIEVSDTGIGMGPEVLPRLFEPFQQGDASTTRRHGGTGLGLSISRQLIELMGGTIEAESVCGQGSIFRVLLPLVEAEAPDAVAEPVAVAATAARGGRVLAAEDNPVNQWLLRSQLQRLGYEPDIYADGRAALTAFTQGDYQAVVTDYHMPIMDGLDLARAIRAAEGGGGSVGAIPIIGMTADAFAETTEECLRAGMNEVVTKPVSLEALGAVLARRITGTLPTAPAMAPGPAGLSVADAPLLDRAITQAVFGDDTDIRDEMAALFATTVDELQDTIRATLTAGNAPALSEAAHSLASAALSLGATRLGLTARALEHAAIAGDLAGAEGLAERVVGLDRETREALAGAEV